MKNILKGTRCYLIGGMEYVKDGRSWRNLVKDHKLGLGNIGITFFDPYDKPFIDEVQENEEARSIMDTWMKEEKYDLVAERMKAVRGFDLRLCDLSDWFIVQINPSIASWGSAEELTTINRAKKPIFIFIDHPEGKKATPKWIMGMIPHKYIYNNLEELMLMLKNIDIGSVTIDSDRWKLLKEEYR